MKIDQPKFIFEHPILITVGFIVIVISIGIYIAFLPQPNDVTEDQITSPQVIKSRDVCKEIPVPEQFSFVSISFGQRLNGFAHYRNLYKTDLSFDEIFEYYKSTLPEKGFSKVYWLDVVGERQISTGKNRIGVTIGYRTKVASFFEYVSGKDWKVYIHCDDRHYNQ